MIAFFLIAGLSIPAPRTEFYLGEVIPLQLPFTIERILKHWVRFRGPRECTVQSSAAAFRVLPAALRGNSRRQRWTRGLRTALAQACAREN